MLLKHIYSSLGCLLTAMLVLLPIGTWAETPVVPSMIDEKAEITVVGQTDLPGICRTKCMLSAGVWPWEATKPCPWWILPPAKH